MSLELTTKLTCEQDRKCMEFLKPNIILTWIKYETVSLQYVYADVSLWP